MYPCSMYVPMQYEACLRLRLESGSVIQGRSGSPVPARIAGRIGSKRPLLSTLVGIIGTDEGLEQEEQKQKDWSSA